MPNIKPPKIFFPRVVAPNGLERNIPNYEYAKHFGYNLIQWHQMLKAVNPGIPITTIKSLLKDPNTYAHWKYLPSDVVIPGMVTPLHRIDKQLKAELKKPYGGQGIPSAATADSLKVVTGQFDKIKHPNHDCWFYDPDTNTLYYMAYGHHINLFTEHFGAFPFHVTNGFAGDVKNGQIRDMQETGTLSEVPRHILPEIVKQWKAHRGIPVSKTPEIQTQGAKGEETKSDTSDANVGISEETAQEDSKGVKTWVDQDSGKTVHQIEGKGGGNYEGHDAIWFNRISNEIFIAYNGRHHDLLEIWPQLMFGDGFGGDFRLALMRFGWHYNYPQDNELEILRSIFARHFGTDLSEAVSQHVASAKTAGEFGPGEAGENVTRNGVKGIDVRGTGLPKTKTYFSSRFGFINGTFYFDNADHTYIMQYLLDNGWTWPDMFTAKQIWGWLQYNSNNGQVIYSIGTDVAKHDPHYLPELNKAANKFFWNAEVANDGEVNFSTRTNDYGTSTWRSGFRFEDKPELPQEKIGSSIYCPSCNSNKTAPVGNFDDAGSLSDNPEHQMHNYLQENDDRSFYCFDCDNSFPMKDHDDYYMAKVAEQLELDGMPNVEPEYEEAPQAQVDFPENLPFKGVGAFKYRKTLGNGVHLFATMPDPAKPSWNQLYDNYSICFGLIDKNLFVAKNHHASIIAALVKSKYYDWGSLFSAPQVWGWIWDTKHDYYIQLSSDDAKFDESEIPTLEEALSELMGREMTVHKGKMFGGLSYGERARTQYKTPLPPEDLDLSMRHSSFSADHKEYELPSGIKVLDYSEKASSHQPGKNDDLFRCFGFLNNTLYLGDRHHAIIQADIIANEFDGDFGRYFSTPMLWGWFNNYDEPVYEDGKMVTKSGPMKVMFKSDDAKQTPEIEPQVMKAIQEWSGHPTVRQGGPPATTADEGSYGARAKRYLENGEEGYEEPESAFHDVGGYGWDDPAEVDFDHHWSKMALTEYDEDAVDYIKQRKPNRGRVQDAVSWGKNLLNPPPKEPDYREDPDDEQAYSTGFAPGDRVRVKKSYPNSTTDDIGVINSALSDGRWSVMLGQSWFKTVDDDELELLDPRVYPDHFDIGETVLTRAKKEGEIVGIEGKKYRVRFIRDNWSASYEAWELRRKVPEDGQLQLPGSLRPMPSDDKPPSKPTPYFVQLAQKAFKCELKRGDEKIDAYGEDMDAAKARAWQKWYELHPDEAHYNSDMEAHFEPNGRVHWKYKGSGTTSTYPSGNRKGSESAYPKNTPPPHSNTTSAWKWSFSPEGELDFWPVQNGKPSHTDRTGFEGLRTNAQGRVYRAEDGYNIFIWKNRPSDGGIDDRDRFALQQRAKEAVLKHVMRELPGAKVKFSKKDDGIKEFKIVEELEPKESAGGMKAEPYDWPTVYIKDGIKYMDPTYFDKKHSPYDFETWKKWKKLHPGWELYTPEFEAQEFPDINTWTPTKFEDEETEPESEPPKPSTEPGEFVPSQWVADQFFSDFNNVPDNSVVKSVNGGHIYKKLGPNTGVVLYRPPNKTKKEVGKIYYDVTPSGGVQSLIPKTLIKFETPKPPPADTLFTKNPELPQLQNPTETGYPGKAPPVEVPNFEQTIPLFETGHIEGVPAPPGAHNTNGDRPIFFDPHTETLFVAQTTCHHADLMPVLGAGFEWIQADIKLGHHAGEKPWIRVHTAGEPPATMLRLLKSLISQMGLQPEITVQGGGGWIKMNIMGDDYKVSKTATFTALKELENDKRTLEWKFSYDGEQFHIWPIKKRWTGDPSHLDMMGIEGLKSHSQGRLYLGVDGEVMAILWSELHPELPDVLNSWTQRHFGKPVDYMHYQVPPGVPRYDPDIAKELPRDKENKIRGYVPPHAMKGQSAKHLFERKKKELKLSPAYRMKEWLGFGEEYPRNDMIRQGSWEAPVWPLRKAMKDPLSVEYRYSYDGKDLDVWPINRSVKGPSHHDKHGAEGYRSHSQGRIYVDPDGGVHNLIWSELHPETGFEVNKWAREKLGKDIDTFEYFNKPGVSRIDNHKEPTVWHIGQQKEGEEIKPLQHYMTKGGQGSGYAGGYWPGYDDDDEHLNASQMAEKARSKGETTYKTDHKDDVVDPSWYKEDGEDVVENDDGTYWLLREDGVRILRVPTGSGSSDYKKPITKPTTTVPVVHRPEQKKDDKPKEPDPTYVNGDWEGLMDAEADPTTEEYRYSFDGKKLNVWSVYPRDKEHGSTHWDKHGLEGYQNHSQGNIYYDAKNGKAYVMVWSELHPESKKQIEAWCKKELGVDPHTFCYLEEAGKPRVPQEDEDEPVTLPEEFRPQQTYQQLEMHIPEDEGGETPEASEEDKQLELSPGMFYHRDPSIFPEKTWNKLLDKGKPKNVTSSVDDIVYLSPEYKNKAKGPFGYVDGKLYIGDKHHALMMRWLLDNGYDWNSLFNAPQMWGWYWLIGDNDNGQFGDIPTNPHTIIISPVTDDAKQDSELEPEVMEAFKERFAQDFPQFTNLEAIFRSAPKARQGTEYGSRAENRYGLDERPEELHAEAMFQRLAGEDWTEFYDTYGRLPNAQLDRYDPIIQKWVPKDVAWDDMLQDDPGWKGTTADDRVHYRYDAETGKAKPWDIIERYPDVNGEGGSNAGKVYEALTGRPQKHLPSVWDNYHPRENALHWRYSYDTGGGFKIWEVEHGYPDHATVTGPFGKTINTQGRVYPLNKEMTEWEILTWPNRPRGMQEGKAKTQFQEAGKKAATQWIHDHYGKDVSIIYTKDNWENHDYDWTKEAGKPSDGFKLGELLYKWSYDGVNDFDIWSVDEKGNPSHTQKYGHKNLWKLGQGRVYKDEKGHITNLVWINRGNKFQQDAGIHLVDETLQKLFGKKADTITFGYEGGDWVLERGMAMRGDKEITDPRKSESIWPPRIKQAATEQQTQRNYDRAMSDTKQVSHHPMDLQWNNDAFEEYRKMHQTGGGYGRPREDYPHYRWSWDPKDGSLSVWQVQNGYPDHYSMFGKYGYNKCVQGRIYHHPSKNEWEVLIWPERPMDIMPGEVKDKLHEKASAVAELWIKDNIDADAKIDHTKGYHHEMVTEYDSPDYPNPRMGIPTPNLSTPEEFQAYWQARIEEGKKQNAKSYVEFVVGDRVRDRIDGKEYFVVDVDDDYEDLVAIPVGARGKEKQGYYLDPDDLDLV